MPTMGKNISHTEQTNAKSWKSPGLPSSDVVRPLKPYMKIRTLGSVKYGNYVASIEKGLSRPYDLLLDLYSRPRVSGRQSGVVSRNKMMALSVQISMDLI